MQSELNTCTDFSGKWRPEQGGVNLEIKQMGCLEIELLNTVNLTDGTYNTEGMPATQTSFMTMAPQEKGGMWWNTNKTHKWIDDGKRLLELATYLGVFTASHKPEGQWTMTQSFVYAVSSDNPQFS